MSDIRSFYIRDKYHPNYNSNLIITDTELAEIVNKIEVVLFTNKGDFIGDLNLGANLEFYLWQTRVSAEFIKNIIQEQFDEYIPELKKYKNSINISITEGTISDILFVDIFINDITINALIS